MIYDMSILFAYNDINRLAQGISSLARVCNPDRFGAKQTLLLLIKYLLIFKKSLMEKTLI